MARLFVDMDGTLARFHDEVQYLERMFEKGFTGKNGRDRKNATGMGLYLCKKLCGKLGIGITAESKWGEGTTIILEFPVSTYVTNL